MIKQDNKSSLTGLLLIGSILIIFNVFVFNNSEETSDSSEKNEPKEEPKDENNLSNENNTEYIIDSTKIETEKFYTLKNDKIKIVFTNKGGEIKSAIII